MLTYHFIQSSTHFTATMPAAKPGKAELWRRLDIADDPTACTNTWEQVVRISVFWNFQSFQSHQKQELVKRLIREALNQSLNDNAFFDLKIRNLFQTDANRCVDAIYFLIQHAKDERKRGTRTSYMTRESYNLLPQCKLIFRGNGIFSSLTAQLEAFAPLVLHHLDHRDGLFHRIPASALRFLYLETFLCENASFQPNSQVILCLGSNGYANQEGFPRAITDDITFVHVVESAVRASPNPSQEPLTLNLVIRNQQ